jgi:hypothetical protein
MADEDNTIQTEQAEVNVAARIVEATKLRAQGQLDDAMRVYASLARMPMPAQQAAKVLELLGDTLMQANRPGDAVTVFKKAYDTAALMNLPSKIEEAKLRAGMPAAPLVAQAIPTVSTPDDAPKPSAEVKLVIPGDEPSSETPLLDALTTRPVFGGDDEVSRHVPTAPRKLNTGGLSTGTGILIILVCLIIAVASILWYLNMNRADAGSANTAPRKRYKLQQPTQPAPVSVTPYLGGSAEVSAPK